jgi:superfamily I DNA and/or RNA helicase
VSFDSIVIDEAAQASEPDIVVPATSASCRVIVVGDHKQLGLVEDISGYFRIFQDGQVRLDTSRVFGLFKSRCSIKTYTV